MQIKLQVDAKTLYSLALHLIVVAMGIELYILSSQNHQLKESRGETVAAQLKTGDLFAIDSLVGLKDGQPLALPPEGQQVIFVFSTRCRFCKADIDTWKEIAEKAKRSRVNVFAVSVDSLAVTRQYAKDNSIVQYNIFLPANADRFLEQNRLPGFPASIVRSGTGRVEGVWMGLLDKSQENEILQKIS